MAEKKEAEILARTFRDRMSVYRKEMRVNPETKESREVEIPVYENVICALSLGSMDVPQERISWREADGCGDLYASGDIP